MLCSHDITTFYKAYSLKLGRRASMHSMLGNYDKCQMLIFQAGLLVTSL